MFVELAARTNFSFRMGASSPEEMVMEAKRLGLSAIGIVDHDGIYGVVRAYRAAKEHGVILHIGSELTLKASSGPETVILLVERHVGYKNLCRILTRAHHGDPKGERRVDLATLAENAEGLLLVLRPSGPAFDEERLRSLAWQAMRQAFHGRTYVMANRRLDGYDDERIARTKRLAAALEAPIFASSRPLYHTKKRKPLADVLYCIKHHTTLDRAGRSLEPNAELVLRGEEAMGRLYRENPEWVEESFAISDRLSFSLGELRYRFPSEEFCRPGETPDDALRRLTEVGLLRRYPQGTPAKVREQCERELVLIGKLQVAPYFISVYDIVEMARKRRILCQGRGSAANSAVCFALGITAVDPARSNLLFERFLSAERAEPPDIDVDFEHERREEVIQDIYLKYGRDRAAMVSEVICYRGKSALREVSKAFSFSKDQEAALSSLVMHHGAPEVDARRVREIGLDPGDGRVAKILSLAQELDGFPRHLSIHVGGFVLSQEPLENVAPIQPATMEGRTIIPWDKDDLDTLGFFKVDVLGLGMLTCVRKTLELLHDHNLWRAGDRFDPIDALGAIPAEDPKVYDAIGLADTIGVFQIESRAQMAMLPRLKPRTFYDLVIEVAIVRPGPIQGGMVHPYLRRRTGKEASASPHPILEPILERTLGVPLFQEQVMQIAMVGAGYLAGEADQLRRDMAAWKKHGRLLRHRERLLEGFARTGITEAFGEALFRQIQGFGEYGFPESHAASFALIVYVSSWQKTHFPGVFACALLNAQPMGFYNPSTIVADAKRHGVRVLPVSVDRSYWDNTLETDPLSANGLSMRLGFRQVKGLSERVSRAIERARMDYPFESMSDLARRTKAADHELGVLAEAGALESLAPGRRVALWEAYTPKIGGLFERVDPSFEPAPALPPTQKIDELLLDYEHVGLSIDDHPMSHLRPELERSCLRHRATPGPLWRSSSLGEVSPGQSIWVAGLVTGRQRPHTASGVTFVSLEDETGIINLVIWEKLFLEERHAIINARFALVRGRLEREGIVTHVIVSSWTRVGLSEGRELRHRARNFH